MERANRCRRMEINCLILVKNLRCFLPDKIALTQFSIEDNAKQGPATGKGVTKGATN